MSNDLTLICEVCKFPIEGDTGSIYVRLGDVSDVRDAERSWQERHGDDLHSNGLDVMRFLTAPPDAHWRVAHDKCRDDHGEGCYEIDAPRISTWPALCRWTAHLLEKNWFGLTDWDCLLRELGGESPTRIRVTAREAA
jgi:hypothetical protein